MKRSFALLLIALLLLVPVFSARADEGARVFTDDGLLTGEEIQRIDARAAEIYEAHSVAPYFFFYGDESDLIPFAGQFVTEHVTESDAIVLGLNSNYYYFVKKGALAEAVFPDAVCEETLWQAFSNVQNDPAGKILAYLNAVDDILQSGAFATAEPVDAPTDDSFTVPDYIALTDGSKPTLVDQEHLLTDAQAETLSKRLREIGSTYQCDVIIATVPDLDGKTAEEYADDFFDYNGYGYGATPDQNGTTVDGDGILLLLAMADRDFAISTSGYAIEAFTDFGIQTYLEDRFLPYLEENDYNSGFNAFADGCEYLLKLAREDVAYDCYHVYADENAMQSSVKTTLNQKAEQLMNAYGVGVYFVQNADVTDADAYLDQFVNDHVYESDAIILCLTPNGYHTRVMGSNALQKFRSNKPKLDKLDNTILPYYSAGDIDGMANAYYEYCEKVLSKRKLNLGALLLSTVSGGLFGLIPVSSMKRQLTSVNRQTGAATYLKPDSFVLTQNSDVLLGKNVSRSVHVVQTTSSGGGRSGGGGFHGGSSTHTSSSGGTHGGHSGKF